MKRSRGGRPGKTSDDTVPEDVENLSQAPPLQQSAGISANLLTRSMNWLEKCLLIFVIGGLIAGIGVASVSQPVIDQVDSVINVFMDLYDLVAPIAIFLILTPSLARLFSTRRMGRFGLFVIRWYAIRKILACL